MAGPFDLVSLATVQAWTGNTSDSTGLSSLIAQISRAILTALNRPNILPATYVETRDGDDHASLTLRQWPVISVSSLLINGQAIQQAPALALGMSAQTGWLLEQFDPTPPGQMQDLTLRYHRFLKGRQNVVIAYSAGYQITGEAATVPASPGPYTLNAQAPLGPWASDQAATYANGTAMVAVAGTPTIGQYAVNAGIYTFASADAGAGVALNYGFVPADLSQAAMEWVAERYAYKSRIGQRSKSLGGQETVSYDIGAVPNFVANAIQPYKRVVWP